MGCEGKFLTFQRRWDERVGDGKETLQQEKEVYGQNPAPSTTIAPINYQNNGNVNKF